LNGSYDVSFKANDGLSDSKIATYTIKVSGDDSSNTKPMLLSKEIYRRTENTVITTIYEYDNKNRMISYHKTSTYLDTRCKFNYDSDDKPEERLLTTD
jgi:hypothetical protein